MRQGTDERIAEKPLLLFFGEMHSSEFEAFLNEIRQRSHMRFERLPYRSTSPAREGEDPAMFETMEGFKEMQSSASVLFYWEFAGHFFWYDNICLQKRDKDSYYYFFDRDADEVLRFVDKCRENGIDARTIYVQTSASEQDLKELFDDCVMWNEYEQFIPDKRERN